MLAEDRVHDYQPDNIFARLSVQILDSKITALECKQGMKGLLDTLGRAVVLVVRRSKPRSPQLHGDRGNYSRGSPEEWNPQSVWPSLVQPVTKKERETHGVDFRVVKSVFPIHSLI